MKYDREVKPGANDSLSKVVGMITAGSSVLDLGVGVGSLGQYLSEQLRCVVDGVECDENFVALAQPYYRRLLNVNLEEPEWSKAFFEQRYDVIVCADILEHLVNAHQVLTDLRGLLTDQGQVII